jgi:choline transport protein
MVVAEKQADRVDESRLRNSTEIDTVRQEAALGHKQELVRNFGLWSVTSLGIVIAKLVNRNLSVHGLN